MVLVMGAGGTQIRLYMTQHALLIRQSEMQLGAVTETCSQHESHLAGVSGSLGQGWQAEAYQPA